MTDWRTISSVAVRRRHRHPVQVAALLAGTVFLVLGVAGFVPGPTVGIDRLAAAGSASTAMLLGLFQVSVLHNVVHLAFGIAGLATSRTVRAARSFLLVGGVAALILGAYGLVVDQAGLTNAVPRNAAADWLHLGLGVVMLAAVLLLHRSHPATTTAT